jgi:hypothetical protein
MKRLTLFLIALPVLLVLVILFPLTRMKTVPWGSKSKPPTTVETNAAATISSTTATAIADESVLPGESILRGYANTNLPPQNDLVLMSRLMDNSLLLLKSAANRPLSANEDWAALFRGQNAAHERFLPDRHVAFNARGQLIDRWGTPLFFHAMGSGRYEVRSAGPDGRLWTDDDLHRNPDGSFRRGTELNPQSLMDDIRKQ